MLIGLSISKCVADMMEHKVNPDDVMLIIGGTDFRLENIDSMINVYKNHIWYDYDRDKIKQLLTQFYKEGRIHQPRQFGHDPQPAYRGHWYRVVLEPKDLSESAQKAWDRFVILASLTK